MNIGLLGFGVVGGGVLELTQSRSDIAVSRVLLRSPKAGLPEGLATYDFNDILTDNAIDTVVEVMGGLHPAYEYVSAAMERGKNVVTANKALIAAYYPELTALAKEKGVALRCTAAVGGGIPWLVNLARVKRLDTVGAVGGIMNGTTNFIMDAMHKSPVDFPAILKEAQDLGYAEADPSADIDGDDIRRKLCISANIAFDAVLEETAIPTFGIRTVTAEDIAAFKAHGFVCKLLAAAESTENGVCAYVEPTLVDAGEPEAAVPANYNLITCTAERVGRQSFFGQGAGRFPTASNVVQDCLTCPVTSPSTPARPTPPSWTAPPRPTPTTCAPPRRTTSCAASPLTTGARASSPPPSTPTPCWHGPGASWRRTPPASSPVSAELLHHAKRGLRCGSLSPFKEIFMIRSNIPPFFVVGYHAA